MSAMMLSLYAVDDQPNQAATLSHFDRYNLQWFAQLRESDRKENNCFVAHEKFSIGSFDKEREIHEKDKHIIREGQFFFTI